MKLTLTGTIENLDLNPPQPSPDVYTAGAWPMLTLALKGDLPAADQIPPKVRNSYVRLSLPRELIRDLKVGALFTVTIETVEI